MSVLDNYETITINGKEIEFKLTIRDAFRAERELTTKNIMSALAEEPLSLENTFIFLKHMIKGEQLTDELFEQLVDELNYTGIYAIVYGCIAKSGILGKKAKNQQAPTMK